MLALNGAGLGSLQDAMDCQLVQQRESVMPCFRQNLKDHFLIVSGLGFPPVHLPRTERGLCLLLTVLVDGGQPRGRTGRAGGGNGRK